MSCAERIRRGWWCWNGAILHFSVTSSNELTTRNTRLLSWRNENNPVVISHPIILMTTHELPSSCLWLKYTGPAQGIETKIPKRERDQRVLRGGKEEASQGKTHLGKSEKSRVTRLGAAWNLALMEIVSYNAWLTFSNRANEGFHQRDPVLCGGSNVVQSPQQHKL